MKKLVAISVLLAGLAAAVFAQDEGKWKVGLMARHISDMLWATSMTGKSEQTSTAPGSTTQTQEFGKYNKGTINFFTERAAKNSWEGKGWAPTPENRLLLSISNTGENYDVYADISLNDWANKWGGVVDFLSQGSADFYAKGTAGIFNAQIGTAGYGGFVSTQATWNDYLGWNQLCRFGVWRYGSSFLVGDDFRTWDEWGTILALGAALGDNFKLSLGYKLKDPNNASAFPDSSNDPTASYSSINGNFMLNGRVTDAIAFDLFYAVKGSDPDTFSRDITGTLPSGYWDNIIGAYVGLNIVENLGLSLGYTANFRAYETGGFLSDPADTPDKSKPRTFTAPFYSGIDIRVSYSGIDKIGLTFNNNISLAGIKATKLEGDWSEAVLDFSNGVYQLAAGQDSNSQDWFHWNTELKATFALVENLGLTLHLGDQLAVVSGASEGDVSGTKVKTTTTSTDNEFRVSLFADYGIGAVNVGIGLFLGVHSKVYERVADGTYTNTYKANSDVVSFGIPVMFKVQF